MRKRNSYDQILTGWLIGSIIPLLIFMIMYWVKYSEIDFTIYLKNIWQMKIFLKLLSLCVLPNLGFFMIFYKLRYDMAARGVIMATFMYAIAVLIAKVL